MGSPSLSVKGMLVVVAAVQGADFRSVHKDLREYLPGMLHLSDGRSMMSGH